MKHNPCQQIAAIRAHELGKIYQDFEEARDREDLDDCELAIISIMLACGALCREDGCTSIDLHNRYYAALGEHMSSFSLHFTETLTAMRRCAPPLGWNWFHFDKKGEKQFYYWLQVSDRPRAPQPTAYKAELTDAALLLSVLNHYYLYQSDYWETPPNSKGSSIPPKAATALAHAVKNGWLVECQFRAAYSITEKGREKVDQLLEELMVNPIMEK